MAEVGLGFGEGPFGRTTRRSFVPRKSPIKFVRLVSSLGPASCLGCPATGSRSCNGAAELFRNWLRDAGSRQGTPDDRRHDDALSCQGAANGFSTLGQ